MKKAREPVLGDADRPAMAPLPHGPVETSAFADAAIVDVRVESVSPADRSSAV